MSMADKKKVFEDQPVASGISPVADHVNVIKIFLAEKEVSTSLCVYALQP